MTVAKRKKKGTALPRLTLLAYNRRDLLAFTEAVEKLGHHVNDLRLIAEEIGRKTRKPKPAAAPAAALVGAPMEGQQTLFQG